MNNLNLLGQLTAPTTVGSGDLLGHRTVFKYHAGTKGLSYSNIIFASKYPMRGGKFPQSHPCHDDPQPTVGGKWTSIDSTGARTEMPGEQPESKTNLGNFRARGYWASCFPEGDGITFEPLKNQNRETIINDISECFQVQVR